jgi:putative nucleotidyltransferase with HDIG domain
VHCSDQLAANLNRRLRFERARLQPRRKHPNEINSGFSRRRNMFRNFAISIIETLRHHGFQAYLVGGCVRDLLLEREPADFDVATSATPAQVMEIFPDTYAVGAQFGVVLVPLPEKERSESDNASPKGNTVEVATFRSDLGYSDGRHPDQVLFSQNPREDVARRDFTINGMMLDPLRGEVLDFVGGRDDLKDGIVRAIGQPERRFAEDKLRMLRAVRFAARFEYEIEAETLIAIQRFASEIKMVSRERVRDELTNMLTEGHARQAFLLLDRTGLLKEILPEISLMKGVQQPPEFHPEGDVFIHTLLALANLPHPCSPTLAWGALLHDVGKPATFRVAPDRIRFDDHVDVGVKIAEEISERLRFSKHDAAQVLALVDNHMRFGHVTRMKESTLKKFMRLPGFDEHLALHRADSLASHRNLSTYEFLQKKRTEIPPEKIRPAPFITGDDLIAAGYSPGPKFREILEAVEDAQLEGRLDSHNAALAFVKNAFPL